MSNTETIESLLGTLAAPRRNHYYYGKLLGVRDFEMEQAYLNGKRWLINRLTLGTGVLCGLNVRAEAGQLCIGSGVAIDGYGREIIVPARTCIDPWKVEEECGDTKELSKEESHVVYLSLCYDECLTDHQPVLVSECDTKETTQAATVVEAFRLQVSTEAPELPARALSEECCDRLVTVKRQAERARDPRYMRELTKAGQAEKRARLLCECLSAPCPETGGCVVLARVRLQRGTIAKIDTCIRRQIYSNQMLAELILCLARKQDECCGEEDEPTEVEPLQVDAVHVDTEEGTTTLGVPGVTLQFGATNDVQAIRATFTGEVDPASVTSDPGGAESGASFLVERIGGGSVPGAMSFGAPMEVTWRGALESGKYRVTLFGDDDPTGARPTIQRVDGTALDGEPPDLMPAASGTPSGDGTPGGNFSFEMVIAKMQEAVSIRTVEVLDAGGKVLTELAGGATPELPAADEPSGLRLTFSGALDPSSVLIYDEYPTHLLSVFVFGMSTSDDGAYVPGAVQFQDDRTFVWRPKDGGALPAGRIYALTLPEQIPEVGAPNVVRSVDGVAIDGSGDGQPGGDLVRAFKVI